MPNDSTRPIDMGFTEFVEKLVLETFDAVLSSHAEQESKLAEATRLASQPLEVTAKEIITDEGIDEELSNLFPPRNRDRERGQPHAIYQGAPYRSIRDDLEEYPPIKKVLNISLPDEEVQNGNLSLQAVSRIKQALRINLAENYVSILKTVLSRGVPRVIVQGGRINSKITMKVVDISDEEGEGEQIDTEKPYFAPNLTNSMRRLSKFQQNPLTNLRLVVNQADDKKPQNSSTVANVLGEIEIDFKIVI